MYKSIADINRKKLLAEALRGNMGQPMLPNAPSGLAYMLNQYLAGKTANEASEAEAMNEQVRQQETSALVEALGKGGLQGPTQDGGPLMPEFTHPAVQETALSHALKTSEQMASPSNSPRYSNSPIYGKDANGNWVVLQTSNQGGLAPAPTPEGVEIFPSAGLAGYDPNLIKGKGDAETSVEVDRIGETAGPAADAAALEAQAVGETETEIALDRQQRMYDQERLQELEAQRAQAFAKNQAKSDQVEMLSGLIDEAKQASGFFTTGFFGSMTEKVPGTPAFDLVAKLDTIRANIGFDKLQEMRENSPTGGALGQVSEMENRLLQAVWGNLENSQSKEQFEQNLELVKRQVEQSWERVNQAYMQDYGEPYFQTEPETGDDSQVILRYDAQGNRIP